MSLKPQTLRKGTTIILDGVVAEKQELLELSETWNEKEENLFRKMLKQGGKFSIQGRKFIVEKKGEVLNSKGEKDGGIIKVPGLDSAF
jgi:hypothetical protein